MKLLMTLLVRDEEDILSANIEFHLSHGVDFIIAMDNLSGDRATEILRGYERDGTLHYIRQTADDYDQRRWVSHMARLARTKYSADWVINSDVDEFWWPEHGDLKYALATVPPSFGAALVERTNFLPRPMTDGEFFADVLTVYERQSRNALGDLLPGKVCHRAFPDIDVEMGNHQVRRNGHAVTTTAAPITILHFPMRSYGQFANKIANGGSALARNTELPASIGATWRHLYKILKNGDLEVYYRAQILDEAAINLGLREGHLIRNDRLKRYFADWRPS
jgi:hypothetical protein